jgi:hypothetical protein
MRALVALLALALCACGRAAPPDCALEATRLIAFTGKDAVDTVTARTYGASCDKAVAVFSVANGDGHPIWAFASPLPRVFGDAYLSPKRDEVEALLQRWSDPAVSTTAQAPDWPATMPHLPAGALVITLDRITYDDIRARDLPMLCHLASPGRESCVFYEPGAAGAAVLFERDAPGEPAQ